MPPPIKAMKTEPILEIGNAYSDDVCVEDEGLQEVLEQFTGSGLYTPGRLVLVYIILV